MSDNVKESNAYESFEGERDTRYEPTSLGEFLPEEVKDEDVISEHRKHWKQMPEFENDSNPPFKKLIVSFRTSDDYDEFQTLIGQKMTMKTKSIWHPFLDKTANTLLRWIETDDD